MIFDYEIKSNLQNIFPGLSFDKCLSFVQLWQILKIDRALLIQRRAQGWAFFEDHSRVELSVELTSLDENANCGTSKIITNLVRIIPDKMVIYQLIRYVPCYTWCEQKLTESHRDRPAVALKNTLRADTPPAWLRLTRYHTLCTSQLIHLVALLTTTGQTLDACIFYMRILLLYT